MKRLFYLYILLILAGCTDTSIEGISTHSNEEFYATIEGSDSRTYVDDQIRLRWTADGRLTIFKKTTYNREFMFTGVTGANAGGFKQISVDDDFWYGADVPYNYAVYPHSSTTQLDETNHFFTLTMPAEQTYVENSFGLGANTMVAVSESGQLMFKNVGSYLRVRLYGKDIAVSSITLASKGNEAIAGKAKVTPSLNGNPTCEMTDTGKSIRLNCLEPVTISEDADNPTDFWIVVPPVTLASGFSVTVENDKGDTQVFEVAKSFTFERNLFTNMKREVTIDNTPYVTFNSDSIKVFSFDHPIDNLGIRHPILQLEYSLNGGQWKQYEDDGLLFGGTYGPLQIRAKSSVGTATNRTDYQYNNSRILFDLNVGVPIYCKGDIRTLIDYENYLTANTSNARFIGLFAGCKDLATAPELPIMNLADNCYKSMFVQTGLISAPELSAENLSDSCYYEMFCSCNKLEKAPKIAAISLARSSCERMFMYCQNLTSAPNLPATNLAENCYKFMFAGWNKLTNAPKLPATNLAKGCYSHMFYANNNLINAPALPATNLAENCYSGMFSNCTKLINAPVLPAKNLAELCYSEMFKNCSELTTAPILPASTLVDHCYYEMFRNCNNLKEVTMLATNIPQYSNSLYYWLDNVSSSGTFTKAIGMTSLPIGTSGIPESWTVVNYEETFYDDGPPSPSMEDERGSI